MSFIILIGIIALIIIGIGLIYEYIPENGTEEEAQELEDSYAVKPIGEANEW